MNHRKRRQSENQKKKRMFTPDGYINDPQDAVCPHCNKKQKPCSHINSLSRAWARDACSKKIKPSKNNDKTSSN